MNIKKLKTSQLLDKVEGDDVPDEIFDELFAREPFGDMFDRLIELEEENSQLKIILKRHQHVESGKSVVEI
ncbi:hypothetical protein LCGC14_2603690 [marine sediment metagenome]|uniref:Uncharacterized protein n=1 Tax=marine sediment metagenome TaxID=412755 RepID=A0A0F9A881_9ZZZZ